MLEFHITLVLVSVGGFILRVGWSFADPVMLQKKPVRVLPHIVDTALLITGVVMALGLADGLMTGWLLAKLVALLGYIGFGVLALRGTGTGRWLGIVGALLCVAYMVSVAFSKSPLPFG